MRKIDKPPKYSMRIILTMSVLTFILLSFLTSFLLMFAKCNFKFTNRKRKKSKYFPKINSKAKRNTFKRIECMAERLIKFI